MKTIRALYVLVPLAAWLMAFPAVVRAEPERPAPALKPAKKMVIADFVTLSTQSILKLKFLDAAGKPTKAPEGGKLNWKSNVTKPRSGTMEMSEGVWKEDVKLYVFSKIPGYEQVCPPRNYTLNLSFQAGKTRFTANWNKKYECTAR